MNLPTHNVCFFLYGTLKSGQIAHYKIEDFVDSEKTIQTKLPSHYLVIRDGLPYAYSWIDRPPKQFKIDQILPVSGELIYSKDGYEKNLAKAIKEYESSELYKPGTCIVETPGGLEVAANFYSAKKATEREATEVKDGKWGIIDDPILGYGFPRLISSIAKMELEKLESCPADMYDKYWSQMWQVQGAFANLCSVLERFCRFRFGAAIAKHKGPEEMDKLWKSKPDLRSMVLPQFVVHNAKQAKDSKAKEIMDGPFSAWYQVRNNMVHSGKEGRKDFDIIVASTLGMMRLLPPTILSVAPEFEGRWQNIVST